MCYYAQTDLARLLQAVADLEREISEQRSALNVLNEPAGAEIRSVPTPLSLRFGVPQRKSTETARALALARRP
jgi:hypothetical protein